MLEFIKNVLDIEIFFYELNADLKSVYFELKQAAARLGTLNILLNIYVLFINDIKYI